MTNVFLRTIESTFFWRLHLEKQNVRKRNWSFHSSRLQSKEGNFKIGHALVCIVHEKPLILIKSRPKNNDMSKILIYFLLQGQFGSHFRFHCLNALVWSSIQCNWFHIMQKKKTPRTTIRQIGYILNQVERRYWQTGSYS